MLLLSPQLSPSIYFRFSQYVPTTRRPTLPLHHKPITPRNHNSLLTRDYWKSSSRDKWRLEIHRMLKNIKINILDCPQLEKTLIIHPKWNNIPQVWPPPWHLLTFNSDTATKLQNMWNTKEFAPQIPKMRKLQGKWNLFLIQKLNFVKQIQTVYQCFPKWHDLESQ